MSLEDVERTIKHGTMHLEFCMELYRVQWDHLYFLHEHPWGVRSWENEEVKEIMGMKVIQRVNGDMCVLE